MGKVDIIVISYNEKLKLAKCLNSIDKHTNKQQHALTVVDNNSKDGTVDYLKKRKNINVIFSKRNLGLPRALNLALRNTYHSLVVCLDDDTEVSQGWLNKLIAPMKKREDIGIVGCKIVFPNKRIFCADYNLNPLGIVGHNELDFGQRDYIKETDAVAGSCWLMRRGLIKEIGYFDGQFSPCQFRDTDYCVQTRLGGYRIIYNGKVSITHHSLFRTQGLFTRNKENFFRKWKRALNKFPLKDSHPADKYFAKGVEHLKNNRFKLALNQFQKRKLLDKRFSKPFYMGLAYEGIKDYKSAIKQYKQLLYIHPENIPANYRLALASKALGFDKNSHSAGKDFLEQMCMARRS